MDPLSVTASAVAVLQLTETIITSCYKYKKSVQDRNKVLEDLVCEMTALKEILCFLRKVANTGGSDRCKTFVSKLLLDNDGLLCQCKSVLETLQSELETGGPLARMGKVMIWPFRKEDVLKAVNRVRCTREILSFALTVDQA